MRSPKARTSGTWSTRRALWNVWSRKRRRTVDVVNARERKDLRVLIWYNTPQSYCSPFNGPSRGRLGGGWGPRFVAVRSTQAYAPIPTLALPLYGSGELLLVCYEQLPRTIQGEGSRCRRGEVVCFQRMKTTVLQNEPVARSLPLQGEGCGGDGVPASSIFNRFRSHTRSEQSAPAPPPAPELRL